MSGDAVLLDSVILIDHLNGIASATDYLREQAAQAHVSAITRAEVLSGIAPEDVPDVRALLDQFPFVSIDQEVADRWGLLTAAARNSGIVLPVIDGLLAATALEHNLTLVTRDTGQIPSMGVAVFNPWRET